MSIDFIEVEGNRIFKALDDDGIPRLFSLKYGIRESSKYWSKSFTKKVNRAIIARVEDDIKKRKDRNSLRHSALLSMTKVIEELPGRRLSRSTSRSSSGSHSRSNGKSNRKSQSRSNSRANYNISLQPQHGPIGKKVLQFLGL